MSNGCVFLLIVLVISSRRLHLAGAPQNLHSLAQLVLDLFFFNSGQIKHFFCLRSIIRKVVFKNAEHGPIS